MRAQAETTKEERPTSGIIPALDILTMEEHPAEYTEKELIMIKEQIEKMDKHNQLEVLAIFNSFGDAVTLNENRNGTLINLSELKKEIVDKVNKYVRYVQNQENYLNSIERQK